jgi:hypothetical protein
MDDAGITFSVVQLALAKNIVHNSEDSELALSSTSLALAIVLEASIQLSVI